MPKKLLFHLLVAVFLTISAVYFFDIGGSQHELIANLLYLLPPFLAVLAGVLATQSYQLDNPRGQTIGLLASGTFALFIGEAIWFVLRNILHTDPFPSGADIFYLAGYPLLFGGLLLEIKSQKFHFKSINQFTRLLIIMLSGLFAFIVFYFGVFLAYKTDAGLLENAIAISYGIGDLILIYPTLIVLKLAFDYGKGRLTIPWLSIFAGFIMMLIADVLFAIYPEQYQVGIKPYNYIDLFWVLSYLCFAYGFIGFYDALSHAQNMLKKKRPTGI